MQRIIIKKKLDPPQNLQFYIILINCFNDRRIFLLPNFKYYTLYIQNAKYVF